MQAPVHTVQLGESAATIAQKYTGNPAREIELLHANAQKPWSNVGGRPVFSTLHAGEVLRLPASWQPHLARISALVDRSRNGMGTPPGIPGTRTVLPGQAFSPGMIGVPGGIPGTTVMRPAGMVPPHYARLSALISAQRVGIGDANSIAQEIGTLQGQVNTAPFADSDGSYASYIQACQAAGNTAVGTLGPDIDSTYGIANTGTNTQNAWGINGSLANVVNDSTSQVSDAGQAQGYLAQMLASYNAAIAAGQAAQGGGGGGGGTTQPGNVVSAAQAAVAAIGNDSNYCSSVKSSGSAVNSTVHNFKVAWNAANPGGQLAYNGQFDAATAAAISTAIGSAGPASCGATPPPKPPPGPQPTVTCPGDPVKHPAGYVCPPVPPTPVGGLVQCPNGTMVASGTACPAATTNWLPWVVGGVAVAAGIGLVVYAQRQKQHTAATTPALPRAGTEHYGYESSRYTHRHY